MKAPNRFQITLPNHRCIKEDRALERPACPQLSQLKRRCLRNIVAPFRPALRASGPNSERADNPGMRYAPKD